MKRSHLLHPQLNGWFVIWLKVLFVILSLISIVWTAAIFYESVSFAASTVDPAADWTWKRLFFASQLLLGAAIGFAITRYTVWVVIACLAAVAFAFVLASSECASLSCSSFEYINQLNAKY